MKISNVLPHHHTTALLFTVLALIAATTAFAGTVELTILQSTDLHGSPAVAKFARWIAEERKADPELLLVDCGDLCNGTFETSCDGGAAMVSYLNACRYDVWVPGNHEFRIGNASFRKDLDLFTSGDVLAANLVFDDPARKPKRSILPWKIFERKGLRIAVVGMVSHRYDDWYDAGLYKGIRFLSPADTLREVMPAVRGAKPDVIVVAAHSDLKASAETKTGNEEWVSSQSIYTNYTDVALFLAGHSHRLVPATEYAPGQWIVQPRDNGGSMAKVRVVYDTEAKKVMTVEASFAESKELEALPDEEMPAPWRKNNAAAREIAARPVVRLPDELVYDPKAKTGGLPPTLVPEAVREATGADAVVLFWTKTLRPTKAELTEKFFYDNFKPYGLTMLTLSPEQLKTVLEEQGDISAHSVGIDPKALPERPVKVVFDAYDIAGCDGQHMKLRAIARQPDVVRKDLDVNLRSAVRDYFLRNWPAR